jgi:hypothetical protein
MMRVCYSACFIVMTLLIWLAQIHTSSAVQEEQPSQPAISVKLQEILDKLDDVLQKYPRGTSLDCTQADLLRDELVQVQVDIASLLRQLSPDSEPASELSDTKKYRVDITNSVVIISEEINSNGLVSDQARSRLETVLDRYRARFSQYSTFIKSEEILALIDAAKNDPASMFAKYMTIQRDAEYIIDNMRAEVPDE